MAKVEYADAIKTVSGALTKINKKSQHAADQKMVLATHRVAATTNPACSRLFLRGLSAVTRTTPVTADEITVRNHFAAVSRGVHARRKDLTKIVQDQQAFRAQKDTPNGYKTFYSYLWHVVEDSLNG
jgi:hypothetical protein